MVSGGSADKWQCLYFSSSVVAWHANHVCPLRHVILGACLGTWTSPRVHLCSKTFGAVIVVVCWSSYWSANSVPSSCGDFLSTDSRFCFVVILERLLTGVWEASWTGSVLTAVGFCASSSDVIQLHLPRQQWASVQPFFRDQQQENPFIPVSGIKTGGCWSPCRSEQIRHFMFACFLPFGDAAELEVRQRHVNPNPAGYWRSLCHFSAAWWSLLFFPCVHKIRRLLEITCSRFSLVY